MVDYLLDCVRSWVEEYDIDGLRLDVAYCLDHDFLRRLRQFTNGLKPEFFLVGETLHGDYNQWVNDQMLHSLSLIHISSGQFSMIPLNLMGPNGKADYAVTGNFASIAAKEAAKYGTVNIAADTSDRNHSYIPTQEQLKLSPDASYFYYCANNTIYGTCLLYTSHQVGKGDGHLSNGNGHRSQHAGHRRHYGDHRHHIDFSPAAGGRGGRLGHCCSFLSPQNVNLI